MADVSPRLELVFVDRFWEWNAGKGLPKKSSWLPMSQEQQRNVREERDLLTLLPDNRTFTKISELDSGIKLFQSEGQWCMEGWSYVRALVRPIGPDLVLAVHADHLPAQQSLRWLRCM